MEDTGSIEFLNYHTTNITPEDDLQKFLACSAELGAKKLEVIRQTGSIEKRGRNPRFKYDYVQEADVLRELRGVLAGAGLALSYSTVGHVSVKDGKQLRTEIGVQFTLTDTETGFAESVVVHAYGMDTQDKGPWKAITGALKYYLTKTFLLPTGDDPEDEPPASTNRSSAPGGQSQSREAQPSQLDAIRKMAKAQGFDDEKRIVKGINSTVTWVERSIGKLGDLTYDEARGVLKWMQMKRDGREPDLSDRPY